jgi:type IV secretory pathway VirB4 component
VRFRTQTIDEDVPWLGHERDDVVLKRDGSVFVLYELQGVAFETLEDWLIAERKQRLNHTFCQIAHEGIAKLTDAVTCAVTRRAIASHHTA